MSSFSPINQSIKTVVQEGRFHGPIADPQVNAESLFESAKFAAASWRPMLDQLKLSLLFEIAQYNNRLQILQNFRIFLLSVSSIILNG
jgi:hypothetical protein